MYPIAALSPAAVSPSGSKVVAVATLEASIVVAEMIANQISDFLLKGVKVNTV